MLVSAAPRGGHGHLAPSQTSRRCSPDVQPSPQSARSLPGHPCRDPTVMPVPEGPFLAWLPAALTVPRGPGWRDSWHVNKGPWEAHFLKTKAGVLAASSWNRLVARPLAWDQQVTRLHSLSLGQVWDWRLHPCPRAWVTSASRGRWPHPLCPCVHSASSASQAAWRSPVPGQDRERGTAAGCRGPWPRLQQPGG